MSHEFETGFSVREAAWHGLAQVLPEYPGREEAIKLAGHDFTVIEKPIFSVEENEVGGIIIPSYEQVQGWKQLVKSTDPNKLFKVVPDSYEVIQNSVLWDIVDAVVEQDKVRYETAGVLREGSVLWVLARIDEPYQVTGDNTLIYPYLLLQTTHDGSGACKASETSVRVICANTWKQADRESGRTGREFTFRHTKNVATRIEDAKAALKGLRTAHEGTIELYEELAATPFSDVQVEKFLSEFILDPRTVGEQVSDRVAKNIETAKAAVLSILNNENGTVTPAIRNTAYGVFNAATEYLDYERSLRPSAGSSKAEALFNRTVLTQGNEKNSVVSIIRDVAAAAA